jgi:hypothetical protein
VARETIVRWRRKTVITIEMRQRTFIRPLQAKVIALCERCSVETLMITPEQAADNLQTTPRAIYGLMEDGKLHSVEMESGLNFICCNSLSELTNEEK